MWNILLFLCAIFLGYNGIKFLKSVRNPKNKYGADTAATGYVGEKIFGKHYASISYLFYGIVFIVFSVIILVSLVKNIFF